MFGLLKLAAGEKTAKSRKANNEFDSLRRK